MTVTSKVCSFVLCGCFTAQMLAQAPAEDRVGFPEGYQNWTVLYIMDRSDNKQIRSIYANDKASSVTDGGQSNYPYGSVVVMETWAALRDTDGNAVLDGRGRYQKDPAATPTIFTMRKERGFGVAYGANRNGEWEYASYTPSRGVATAASASAGCATCHLQAGAGKDWVFRAATHLRDGGGDPDTLGAVPGAIIKNYAFVPGSLTVKTGTTVVFYNDDVVAHNIADDAAGGWISQNMRAGTGVQAVTFNVPGEFNYHCAIHPNMKGKITVTR